MPQVGTLESWYAMTTTQYVRHKVNLTRNTANKHNTTTNERVLIVDCETTLDFSQQLRLAGYCLYSIAGNLVVDRGLVVDDLTADELVTLVEYAATHNLTVQDRQQFIQGILYPELARGTSLVNHNIVFDLGCLATSWITDDSAFYLKLCSCEGKACKAHPPVVVRSLTFPKALMYVESDSPYGAIMDTMTLGRALLGPGEMSLKGMGTRFKCETVKQISDEHGDTLTSEYLDYTMRDVQATLELFLAEMREYARHGLESPITGILSEAGIGKAYLQQLGIPAFIENHREVPEWMYPIAQRAYYGARSEVKIRLEPTEIRYTDFKSQYPTVNALLGLQDLLLAEYVRVEHRTDGVQRFLNQVTLADLQSPATWRKLRGCFVKLAPDYDVLPAKFSEVDDLGDKNTGYAVCYLKGTGDTKAPENWYTLCDAVASKLLSGKAPILIDAVVMYPSGRIHTHTLNLFGDERYTIDLSKQDFFTEVINLRTRVKAELKTAKKAGDSDQAGYLDSLQLALKLLANSTSYGVFAETRFDSGIETAGKYYASPIAASITSGARLLLAIAETLGKERGLTYAMCDTDSMAYARPSTMERETFYSLVDEIVTWFTPLSPYAGKAALFELEEVNEYNGVQEPLYFLGVSCKRYALYNRLSDGTYRFRKISAHATGRFQFDRDLPLPDGVPGSTLYGKMWHYLLWYRAIEQAERGITAIEVPIEEWSMQSVRYQESISTPGKLKQFSYIPGIRPYSFFTATPMVPGHKHRYVLSYTPTHEAMMSATAYIANSMVVDNDPLYDTLALRFRQFFTHSEAKAANGNQVGVLERRVLEVSNIQDRTRSGSKPVVTPNSSQLALWSVPS